MIQVFAFYFFAGILLVSAALVISVRNPAHSVLFLIMAFFNGAGLFILLGAEFVAFVLIIVYVGAVAVLFLFVVMMLDIDFAAVRKGARQHIVLGLAFGAVFLSELYVMFRAWPRDPVASPAGAIDGELTNTEAIGRVLYTDYIYPFQVSGLILLAAMVGAIVLTLRIRYDVRRQNVGDQLAVRREDAVELRKVTPGTGV